MKRVVFALIITHISLLITLVGTVHAQAENPWPMVAHDPQRTSWTTEQPNTSLSVDWYRPIEAYIPENVQVIAANNLLYISTARGLYALYATDPDGTGPLKGGDTAWRYDTQMPLGNSPTVDTVANPPVVYVGGYDRKLHAFNANTGAPFWSFDNATAGYSTNPLVIRDTYTGNQPVVIAANRDGSVYALGGQGHPQAGQQLWKLTTGAYIDYSPAYKNGVVYVVSNDQYVYAINIASGTQKWKSAKLPGEGYHSYWLVVYTDPNTNQDYIITSGAAAYRAGLVPGTNTLPCHIWSTEDEPCSAYDEIQTTDLFSGIPGGNDTANQIGPNITDNSSWTHGNQVINGTQIFNYLENNPSSDPHFHKPWRRTTVILNQADGSEYTFDANGNGYRDYAPFPFWGTRSGNRYPPLIGPDGVIYSNIPFYSGGIPQGKTLGWKLGQSHLSVIGGQGAVDEPNGLSGGGNMIYRSICCDRGGDSFSITTPKSTGFYWGYSPASLGETYTPGYDQMWWGVTQYTGYPTATGGYGGSGQSGSPHIGKNGIYQSHGDQNPMVPYRGHLYIHRSNAIIAYGPSTGPGKESLVTINPVNDTTLIVPSLVDLKARLESQIQKMIDSYNATGKLLNPGYYNTGQSGFKDIFNDYFTNPGETMYALTRAYPYLSDGLKASVKTYLLKVYNDYFASSPTLTYAKVGWLDGVSRDWMDIPADATDYSHLPPPSATPPPAPPGKKTQINDDGSNLMHWQQNIYGLWKYAAILGDSIPNPTGSPTALQIYTLVKGSYLLDAPMNSQLNKANGWNTNAYLDSYISFLSLQTLAQKQSTDAALRTTVTNALNSLESYRVSNFKTDSPWVDCSNPPICQPVDSQYYNRVFDISQNFIYLFPELGDYLNTHALAAVQNAYADYQYVGPYWFVSHFNATEDEGVMQPLEDLWLFQAKAYALKQSREELTKYLDVPTFAIGDLFYINNLTAAIEAPLAGPCTPSCTGKSCGDDGCGGSCGTCTGGLVCSPVYACVAPSPTPIPSVTPTPSPTPIGGAPVMLIDAGSTSNVTVNGQTWLADTDYTGGTTSSYSNGIPNTTIPQIYQTERWGMTGYSIPVTNGTYVVKLHFAENYTGITAAGQRVFNVNVEGTPLNNLDIYAETGGRNLALIKTFSVTVSDGSLTIGFTPKVENPLIDGIEVTNPAAAPLQGDFNSDGVVDWQDWLSFIPNFGKALSQFQLVTGSLVSIFDLNKLIGYLYK